MSIIEWQDKKFQEVYDNVYSTTKYRRIIDPSFTLQDLRNILNTLYVNDGNDQGGRGEVGDIVSSANIAAHEQVFVEWKKELSSARCAD
jgi:hypothetical protein